MRLMHLFADVHCTEGIISCPPEGEEDRGDDETKLKISGRQVFVWTAIDADTRSFRLSMHHTERRTPTPSHLSRGSSIRALGRLSCWRTEVHGTRGLSIAGKPWLHVTFGCGNVMERLSKR